MLVLLRASGASAQPAASTPVERADDLTSKATASVYFISGDVDVDLNVRHKFGNLVGWLGGFIAPHDESIGRLGVEYDFQREGLLVIPTLQLGSNGLVAGSLYAEIGGRLFGIAGYSQTNERSFFTLAFDPNESVQLGAGLHLSGYDRLVAYTIFDVRLHTRQQDTHLLWRHRLDTSNGVTMDLLYKSGDLDEGGYVKAFGISLYWDRPTWFVRAAYDPYVNFSEATMLRVGAGYKF